MSDDEMLALVMSLVIATACAWKWYQAVALVKCANGAARGVVSLLPVACAGIVFLVLRTMASHDVRDSGTYLSFYLVMGAAWVGAAWRTMAVCDLHVREDVLERGNMAAAIQAVGMLLGLSLAFAGANVGDGPGWWVVVFCAFLSTATLGVAWAVLGRAAGLSEKITVGRDVRAGARAAVWLLCAGVIVGRAVAGNWQSADQAVADFARMAWPVAGLLGAALVIERVPETDQGAGWAMSSAALAIYVVLTALWLVFLGWPA